MCGIGGMLGDLAGLDGAALLSALGHRGPDQQASLSPSPGVWLSAARLAIRDPSPAGAQPMQSDDGALSLVYNGEVYNASPLRDALAARGHRFRSRSDTEVVLRGYAEWGDEVTERLDGMFAFALWDGARRRLLLARDPLGVKPLWMARGSRALAFASEVRALLAAGAAPRSVEPAAVASFLAAGSVAEPRALLRGVEALPPGCRLAVDAVDGGTLAPRLARFFSLPAEGTRSPAVTAAAEEVRARLDASIDAHLESDVPLGILLSGGIDSAVLALLAARHRRGALSCFHVRVGEAAASRARSLASSLELPYREVRIDAAPSALLSALAAQDQPSVDGGNTFLIARAIREAGLKAALTGLGADELFLGYPLHRSYVRARSLGARLPRVAAPLGRVAVHMGGRLAASSVHVPWRLEKLAAVAAATLGADGAGLHAALRSLFPPSSARLLQPDGPRFATGALDETAATPSRHELRGYLVDTLLRDADVMSMAHGVELRVPLLDRRLVETVVSLDGALKLRPGRKKPLLVDAVPELPRAFRDARKEGFVLPLERWLFGALRARVAERLQDAGAARRLGLDPPSVARVWSRFLRRPDSGAAHRAWALFALLGWAEAHGASA